MTLLTPEHVASEAENLLNSVIGSIKDLRLEIEDLKKRSGLAKIWKRPKAARR